MKGKIVWMILSCLIVVALVLASCAPAAVEEEEEVVPEEKEVAPVEEEEEEEVMVVPVEKGPKYGGWATGATSSLVTGGWDPVHSLSYWWLAPVSLALMRGDYWKGKAGTGEVSWYWAVQEEPQYMTKGLAKSWDIPDAQTIIFHLHEGIRWHDKPPVNGREVTAEDIRWSFQRLLDTSTSGLPPIAAMLGGLTFEAPDKYTFITKAGIPDLRSLFTLRDWYRHTAREVIETYGDQEDWRNVVGNGPFMLTDYVKDSSLTYVKNPAYWETDPEGNPVPYIDGYTLLLIRDASTRLAAMRAGKIDILERVEWRDAQDLIRTNPELMHTEPYPFYIHYITLPCDTPPFDDLKVRKAMSMAIDREAICRDYFQGYADILTAGMLPPGSAFYTPLEELPPSARENFDYNPEKARELLAEAGYPNGFQTTISIDSLREDMASLLRSYWQEIGIDAEIKVYEPAVLTSMVYGMKVPGARVGVWGFSWGNWSWVYQPGSRWCFARIVDPTLEEMILDASEDWQDWDAWVEHWKKINVHVIEQLYEFPVPEGSRMTFWHPWVKNYHGEYSLGRTDWGGYRAYIWLDK